MVMKEKKNERNKQHKSIIQTFTAQNIIQKRIFDCIEFETWTAV